MIEGVAMRKLSLFSGICGIDLAAHWAGMETVAFCEREPFPQQVIRSRFPGRPIYDDVCTLTATRLKEDGILGPTRTIDIISAGYPCQPFSNAGKREGAEDDRHLWPEVKRLLQEISPAWFLGENVAGHISLGLDNVLADLESIGYAWTTFVIPSRLQPSVPRTEETESSLWPTPTATETTARDNIELTETGRRKTKSGSSHSVDLATTVKMWPTPAGQEPGVKASRLVDKNGNPPTHPNQRLYDKETGRLAQTGLQQAVEIMKMWPTPQVRDFRSGDSPDSPRAARKQEQGWSPNLNDAVKMWPTPVADDTGYRQGKYAQGGTALSTAAEGQLNPAWVECLMGFPIGWTDIDGPQA